MALLRLEKHSRSSQPTVCGCEEHPAGEWRGNHALPESGANMERGNDRVARIGGSREHWHLRYAWEKGKSRALWAGFNSMAARAATYLFQRNASGSSIFMAIEGAHGICQRRGS